MTWWRGLIVAFLLGALLMLALSITDEPRNPWNVMQNTPGHS